MAGMTHLYASTASAWRPTSTRGNNTWQSIAAMSLREARSPASTGSVYMDSAISVLRTLGASQSGR